MKIAELVAHGVKVCGGGVDYQNEYLGKLMADGDVLLTPRGEEVVAAFTVAKAPPPVKKLVPEVKPVLTHPRKRLPVNDELKDLED
jgi:hypothetical protein